MILYSILTNYVDCLTDSARLQLKHKHIVLPTQRILFFFVEFLRGTFVYQASDKNTVYCNRV